MNYLEKLLEGVEVEWKPLDEIILSLKTGLNPRKNFTLNSNNAEGYYVTVREIIDGKVVFLDKTDKVNDEALKLINNRSNLEAGDILFSGTGTVGKIAVIENTPRKWNIKEGVYVIKPNQEIINTKFLSYLLGSGDIVKVYSQKIVGSPVVSLPMKELRKIEIPIPALEVQKEIVRILDIFSALAAQLAAQLANCKKQYAFYREDFFNFDEKEVKYLPLGDESIGEFQRGKRFVKNDMIEEGVPCIHYGEMYTHYGTWADKSKSFLTKELVEDKKLRVAEKGDVVIVAAGETIDDIGLGTAWLGNEGVVIHDACFFYKTSLDPKYVAYFTRTRQFHDQIIKHISSGKISAINARGLSMVKIPVPTPEEQKRIATILDKFDTLTASISEGLPREIELREKQYEYYRDMLLTFPKDNAEA